MDKIIIFAVLSILLVIVSWRTLLNYKTHGFYRFISWECIAWLISVVATLFAFIDKHKDGMVYATGSTKSRTRLYRMGITKYLDEIKEDFDIFGELENGWEEFRKDIEYEAFLVKLKDN